MLTFDVAGQLGYGLQLHREEYFVHQIHAPATSNPKYSQDFSNFASSLDRAPYGV
jgi:hypothetical protein